MSQQQHAPTSDSPPATPTMGRRRWLAMGGTAVGAGVTGALAGAGPAGAAPATQAWLCGGNGGVTTANFIGPLNTTPLIFKTTPLGGSNVERMRLTPAGRLAIGTTTPTATLHVAGNLAGGAARGANSGAGPGVAGTSSGGAGVSGTSTSSYGVDGIGPSAGVHAEGGTYGVYSSGETVGVYGGGNTWGLYGSGGTYGVFGSGNTFGVNGSGTTGVRGSGTAIGVFGTTTDVNNGAVIGDGGQYGVMGRNARTAGVRGDSGYVGVWGQGTTYAVYALATDPTNQSFGVFAECSNTNSFAVYAKGNAHVTGTLSKAAGSFKIDHPLEPERKWLSHSFVESPDMMNVYNGTVTLNARGEAVVRLPKYFETLNRDFRYQLTAIGGPAPDLHVKSEMAGNRFRIGGGPAGGKVSWQVTGIRQDDYAKAHPIKVEERKRGDEVGTRAFVPRGSGAKASPALVSPRAGRVRGVKPSVAHDPDLPELPPLRK